MIQDNQLGWLIDLGYKVDQGESIYSGYYTLMVNGVDFDNMSEVIRERADLARTTISYNMSGSKK